MKKILSMLGLGALVLAAAIGSGAYAARAADFVAPAKESDGVVTINSTETHHNLYVTGGDISVNGATTGDLFAAGGSVAIDGPVEQDVMVAGGTVTISEPVNGDLRVAGGKVTLNAPVKGDVLVGAGMLVITDKASVGGELRAGGGTFTINGPVAGGVNLMAERVTLNSAIGGPVKVTAKEEFVIGSSADIAGEVSYLGKKQAVVAEGANANVSFTEFRKHQQDRGERAGILGFLLGSFVIKFFAMVLAGLLALRLFRTHITQVTSGMMSRPWVNLGIGFVAVVVTPVAVILALILLVGYYIALIVGLAYALALLIAGLIAIFFLGAWIIKMLTKKPALVLDWQALVIGTVVMMLLKFVPVVGWIICAGLLLMAFGAMITSCRHNLKRGHSGSVSPTGHSETGHHSL